MGTCVMKKAASSVNHALKTALGTSAHTHVRVKLELRSCPLWLHKDMHVTYERYVFQGGGGSAGGV